jgi:hypothetical protein
MSGAVNETVLADILETAGQKAEEIRVEIASLKERTVCYRLDLSNGWAQR